MRIYMDGALFTSAERRWNCEVAAELRALGYEVFLPQEVEGNGEGDFNAPHIFCGDVKGQDGCEATLAWLEGPDPDSGTCWEHARSIAQGKPTISYTTDLRFTGAADGPHDLNLMMTQSAPILRFHCDTTPHHIAVTVDRFLCLKQT